MEDNSLRSRVFQSIRDDILKGKYSEGEELREATLGKELGVSRTPVREALRQLELEGLVEIVPNKGAYVVGISQKDVHDIYVIRSMLEGLCARWAAEHITQEPVSYTHLDVYKRQIQNTAKMNLDQAEAKQKLIRENIARLQRERLELEESSEEIEANQESIQVEMCIRDSLKTVQEA